MAPPVWYVTFGEVLKLRGTGFADDDDCSWEGEEDITLHSVWPDGADLSRGIIYVCITVLCVYLPPS